MYRTGTLMHCWLEHKWYSHMENNLTVPQKFKHGIAIWPSDSIIGICSRKLKICSYKHVYTNVYSDTIHNRQKVGTTQKCTSQLLSGQTECVHPHSADSLSHQKGSTNTWYNTDEPHKHHLHERNQSQEITYVWLHSWEIHSTGKPRDRKRISTAWDLEGEGNDC